MSTLDKRDEYIDVYQDYRKLQFNNCIHRAHRP